MKARLGIDIGGTFVDLVLAGDGGELAFEKVLARPSDLIGSIGDGVVRLLERAGASGGDVADVMHATTRGSNTVIERSGPRTALVTTSGFRDVLQIQRALRWSMYDVQLRKPEPLVPRSLAFEVKERMLADGSVHIPLDEEDLLSVVSRLRAAGVEAVAVAFLHSYANPAHERRAAELLEAELPGVLVTRSSDISLQAREYERANTAVVNAYIARSVAQYMTALVEKLADVGIEAPVWVMQSSGGLVSVGQAAERPVRVLESGPAAGVVGAVTFGRSAGFDDVISFDMGGTTAKVAVVSAGLPAMATYFELQRTGSRRGSGLPVDIPALDLVEIGSGGGSIAEVRHGTLHVGPRSAGAEPGPACYGLGGRAATVTDANLLLGYYDPATFAGGITLDRAAAEEAIASLAQQLGTDMMHAAWGIHELVSLEMEHAIRLVSINRGFDPREHALVCTGGSAPAHGCRLARALGCRLAIIPRAASGGSARGLLESAASSEVTRTAPVRLGEQDAQSRCAQIVEELHREARRTSFDGAGALTTQLSVGMRYVGQGYELVVPVRRDGSDPALLAEAFHDSYERVYGYRCEQPVEVVTWHLSMTRDPPAGSQTSAPLQAPAAPAAAARRRAYFPETGLVDVAVHARDGLRPGDRLDGPCVISEKTTSTVVLSGDRVEVGTDRSLLVHVEAL